MTQFLRKQNKSVISRWNKRYFSFFENYTKTSQHYDKTRRAVGTNHLDATLFALYNNKYEPISAYYVGDNDKKYDDFLRELRVLDGGCGTGNYLMHLRNLGIGSITGLEFNQGMLGQCKSKLLRDGGSSNCLVQFYNTSIVDIPFKSGSFDVIMVNQVFHHLDSEETRKNNHENVRATLSSCYDKLNENGVLFMTTSYASQMKQFWCYQPFPSCLKIIDEKYHEFSWWNESLINVGFRKVDQSIITETNMRTEEYFNLNGLLDEEWRNGDSTFALVHGDELKNGQNKIKKVISDEAEKKLFIDKFENLRQTLGHSVALVAYK